MLEGRIMSGCLSNALVMGDLLSSTQINRLVGSLFYIIVTHVIF